MKMTLLRTHLVLFLLISVTTGLRSQEIFHDAGGERIRVFTDRTTYIAGEEILFSAFVCNGNNLLNEDFSRIFYGELITPDGFKIAGGKYPLQQFAGWGSLKIPDETISGIYYLRFYTRFMRNTGPEGYMYTMLKIINPYNTDVLSGKDVVDTVTVSPNHTGRENSTRIISVSPDKETFLPREQVRIRVNLGSEKDLPVSICLSVIPEYTYNDHVVPGKIVTDSSSTGLYLPETRGISLSGQLVDKESRNPLPFTRINLSIIGDKDLLVKTTDSSGRFYFALPYYHGSKDIFLSAEDLPDVSPQILIDNDFCSRSVSLPSPGFTLSDNEMNAVYKLAVNRRVSEMFRQDTAKGNFFSEGDSVRFYSTPSDVFIMDKYIDLPTLEEYFYELPVNIKLRKVQGKKQFRFYTTQEEMSFRAPLILIDWVAVSDIEKILAMSPLSIERIEVVNSLYVKGNIIYGGIISFISKKNDFAGIDLPTSGTFINYTFLQPCSGSIPPGPTLIHIPDSRNTLYWNPALQIYEEGVADISFPAPDTPGTYDILLRTISSAGEVTFTYETIVVTTR